MECRVAALIELQGCHKKQSRAFLTLYPEPLNIFYVRVA